MGEFLIILIVSLINIFVSILCSVILITLYLRNFYYIKPFYRSNNFRFESVVFIFFLIFGVLDVLNGGHFFLVILCEPGDSSRIFTSAPESDDQFFLSGTAYVSGDVNGRSFLFKKSIYSNRGFYNKDWRIFCSYRGWPWLVSPRSCLNEFHQYTENRWKRVCRRVRIARRYTRSEPFFWLFWQGSCTYKWYQKH